MDTSYAAAWTAIYRLIAEGWSWSGHERNCCFLNTGDGRFADVSAVSGLDLADDGRAVAVVDWDQDGRLDLWVSNRSAPSLRFLRNNAKTPNRYLAVRLRGTRCNRDAIGARVELQLAQGTPRLIARSLRAGEGFLAQSSKWLHFGLGKDGVPGRLVVKWPGGKSEEFRSLAANRRYEIVQGTGKAVVWNGPRKPGDVQLPDVKPPEPQPDSQIRVVVFRRNRPTLEKLAYHSMDGAATSLESPRTGPTLITLWASWCPPCLAELREFAEQKRKLKKQGIAVLALNVDGLDPETGAKTDRVKQLLADRKWNFESGAATPATIRALEQIQYEIIQKLKPLPVPTSFLLDENNGVVAMYKGRVEVSQIISDAKLASAPPHIVRDAAVPFSGRWLHNVAPERESVGALSVVAAFLTDPRVIAVTAGLMAFLFVTYFRKRRRTAAAAAQANLRDSSGSDPSSAVPPND